VSMNGGLYEFAVTRGASPGDAGSNISNTGTLTTAASGTGSVPSGTIVLTAPEVEGIVSGSINLSGIQRANRIEVHGNTVSLASDLDATTVAGSSKQITVVAACGCAVPDLQDSIDIAAAGASITLGNGTFAVNKTLNVNKSVTFGGQSGDEADTVIDAR